MDTIPLLVILAASIAVFALLVRKGKRIATAALAAINGAGAFGMAWWAGHILYYDGVMAEELTICAVSIALLTALTLGGLTLEARGKVAFAVVLLAVAALPVVAVYSFLFYLDAHPIAWR